MFTNKIFIFVYILVGGNQ